MLFGSAGGGQSRVVLRLIPPGDLNPIEVDRVLTPSPTDSRPVGEGARYLGYGVMEAYGSGKKNTKDGQLTRACLRPPFDFTVQMRARVECEPQLKDLTDALIAVGTLGGMGARSRKGYGSLVLQSLRVNDEEAWRAPGSTSELSQAIAALRPGRDRTARPEYTALSSETRHVLALSGTRNPVELLDLVGRELVWYRSWGRNGMVFRNQRSERNFKSDHDLMKTPASRRQTHPRRIAFGLPHNYGRRREDKVGPGADLDRRASPLFIHVHQCRDIPVAVLSFLPARFLPAARPEVSVGGARVPQAPETELYGPIHEFLDRLLDAGKRKEPFTEVIEVPR